ncbi:pkd2 [Symbiodinium sp. CCMP2592]|nr:pkd2 [Symbiodinium sp. CCMP2592]
MAVQAIFYNAQLELFVLSQVRFSLRRSGLLRRNKALWTLPGSVYRNAGIITTDCCALFIVLMLAIIEVRQLREAARQSLQLRSHILNPFRFASIGIFLGFVSFGAFYIYLNVETDSLSSDLAGLEPVQNYTAGGMLKAAVLSEMFRVSQWMGLGQGALGLVPLCARLRTENGLKAFFVVFANFAMGAAQLTQLSYCRASLDACSEVLMGDVDFMGMFAIAPVSVAQMGYGKHATTEATMWFLLFMAARLGSDELVVIILVLVNLFIAIINEAYIQVNEAFWLHPITKVIKVPDSTFWPQEGSPAWDVSEGPKSLTVANAVLGFDPFDMPHMHRESSSGAADHMRL